MDTKEIWRDVEGYDNYLVSSQGNVKSKERFSSHMPRPGHKKSVLLNQHVGTRRGYALIKIYKKGIFKSASVHRLVAKAFLPNPKNKPQVNHINSIRHDNRVENLEWVTVSENIIHGYKFGDMVSPCTMKNKFGKDHPASKAILQMNDDGDLISEFIGIGYASRTTGIVQSSISNCCLGKLKHAGGFVWKYKS